MTAFGKASLAALALMAAAAPAGADDIFVRSVRIAATDVPKAADFYKAAFGLHEVRRLEFPALMEIILNNGDTPEAAAKSTHAPIVIMTRPKDYDGGGLANVILSVSDMDAAIARAEAAGGTVFRKPAKLADGTQYAFIRDPEGNQVELLKSP